MKYAVGEKCYLAKSELDIEDALSLFNTSE